MLLLSPWIAGIATSPHLRISVSNTANNNIVVIPPPLLALLLPRLFLPCMLLRNLLQLPLLQFILLSLLPITSRGLVRSSGDGIDNEGIIIVHGTSQRGHSDGQTRVGSLQLIVFVLLVVDAVVGRIVIPLLGRAVRTILGLDIVIVSAASAAIATSLLAPRAIVKVAVPCIVVDPSAPSMSISRQPETRGEDAREETRRPSY